MWLEQSSVCTISHNLNTAERAPHQVSLLWQIEGVYPDNARVVVKLAIGGKAVDISQYIVKVVGQKEFARYSKDLSK